MKTYNSMPRMVRKLEANERIDLNVWDVATKTIIFTGTAQEVANKFGVTARHVQSAHQQKYRLLSKYAIRTKSIKPDES